MTEHIIGDASAVRGWRRSSYSGPESGSCVEVLDGHPAGVPVRDSKQPHGPTIVFEASIWSRFVATLKDASG